MKILDVTLMFLSFLGAGVSSAQPNGSANAPGSFVEVDGSRLYYEECGTGPKAVVLLHDGVVNSAVWDDVWPTLCKQFHVIRYDRRGYGRSPATKKPYYEADDVAAILRDRKVSQAALVGSSHGGNIALSVALRYPAQISDLVLVGPEADGFPYSEHFILAQMEFQKAKDPTEVRVKNIYFIAPGDDAAREHLRKLLNASPQDHKHSDMPLPEKPVFPYVRDLRIPTLILTGSVDIADNQAVSGALAMSIPGAARVVVPDTGHLLYLEKPEVFSSLVIEFLTSHGF
ncbi:MAG TPA: alpha/beta hydrolase [Edaphobacter sp.]|jgi:pimeloyl-ACP methyl ester carboxylesterase|nr:alpha/beta hydrolase [Edaphobacter sp.]